MKNKIEVDNHKKSIVISNFHKICELLSSIEVENFSANNDIRIQIDENNSIFLNKDQFQKYQEFVESFSDVITAFKDKPSVISQQINKAIWYVLDLKNETPKFSRKTREKFAIKDLFVQDNLIPSLFTIYFPICGISSDDLPKMLGNIEVCVFDEEKLSQFKEYFKLEKQNQKYWDETFRQAPILNKPVAKISCPAPNIDVAKNIAENELELTIDIINFFTDLIPFHKGHIFLPGESISITSNIASLTNAENQKYSFEWKTFGPITELSLKYFFEINQKFGLGFERISSLLCKSRNEFEDKLITAIRWAGRATIQKRKEESFLLYAIALESLILFENEKEELIFRLRTRVSHLLGNNYEERSNISSDIGKLYGIRSKIVHSGSYDVSSKDIEAIRYFTKSSILTILNKEPFTSMTTLSNLTDWFSEKLLS